MKHDFAEIKRTCDGMMRPEVYAEIYRTALAAPGEVYVELGTAHAAATVCLALGLRDSGREEAGMVLSYDRFESKPGRAAYSGQDNFAIALANLERWGVDSMVTIVPGDAEIVLPHSLGTLDDVGLVMLDMDGRIDRDLAVMVPRVRAGAALVVDDVADRVRVTVKSGRASVDQKHRISKLLLDSAAACDLVRERTMVYQTWFGLFGDAPWEEWPQVERMDAYRRLVFASTEEVRAC